MENKIVIFKGRKIRKTLHGGEWWFSVVDVIEALTDSERPSAYWTAMKARVQSEDGFQLSTICRQLNKKFKGLKHENLRDHMDDFELIFNMPGELTTTKK